MKKIAFYFGLFDPFNRGHLNITVRALRDADKIIIGVEKNPNCTFNMAERIEMIRQTIRDFMELDCGASQFRKEIRERLLINPNIIEVVAIEGEAVDAAIRCGANIIVRGIRNDYDQHLESELMDCILEQFRVRNYDIAGYRLTSTNGEVVHMSSTVAKNMCERGEYIAALHHVTPSVHNRMMVRYLEPRFIECFGRNHRLWQQLQEAYLPRGFANFTSVAYMLNRLAIECVQTGLADDLTSLRQAIFLYYLADTPGASADWVAKNLKTTTSLDVQTILRAAAHPLDVNLNVDTRLLIRCGLLLVADEDNYFLHCRLLKAAGKREVLQELAQCNPRTGYLQPHEYEKALQVIAKAVK